MEHILFYEINAVLTEPLHIGNEGDRNGEVLIHPVTREPFIQASSIAGIMRNAVESLGEEGNAAYWFGDRNLAASAQNESKISITDGLFNGRVIMERRPRVSIDPITGSVSGLAIKGTGKRSGQKFEIDCVGAGNTFTYSLTVKCSGTENTEVHRLIINALGMINDGELQFGGQKSNGFGFIKLLEVRYKDFNLKEKTDRNMWLHNEFKLENIDIPQGDAQNIAYRIIIKGKTEGELLVKSIAVPGFGADIPDAANIRNSRNEFIIPGSSFKGSIRNQFTQIARKIGKEGLIEASFGSMEKSGSVISLDTVVGDIEGNDKQPITHHIHIDKFTGGVISKALFSEKSIAGELELSILIKKSAKQIEIFALIMMTLRDLAIGKFNLGSGYASGRGFLDIDTISVFSDGREYVFDLKNGISQDAEALINNAVQSLK